MNEVVYHLGSKSDIGTSSAFATEACHGLGSSNDGISTLVNGLSAGLLATESLVVVHQCVRISK